MAKGVEDSDGTYQIWSSGSDNKKMRHPPHKVLYPKEEEGGSGGTRWFKDDEDDSDDGKMKNEKGEESDEEDKEQNGKCFLTTSPKYPLKAMVRDLLVALNVPLNSYRFILSDFDETCSYLNDMLIFMSSEAEKSKALL